LSLPRAGGSAGDSDDDCTVLYPKVMVPRFHFEPLPVSEALTDIFYYNLIGIFCGLIGNKTHKECWCCCCKLLSKKGLLTIHDATG